ncbi:MAG: shikimate kinase [Pseudomonadota bacterium]
MREIEQTPAEVSPAVAPLVLLRTVVMVGMMGAGKTAVGRALGARLAVPFIDSDAEIETAANLSVPEIFDRDGEAFFRARESEIIARLLSGPPGILSVGGGAFLSAENRDLISAHGVSVLLDADVDLLWSRVKHKDTRPLLRTADPKATLTALFAARVPIYAQADLTVPCEAGLSIEAMAQRVVTTLLSRRDVLVAKDA